MTPLNNVIIEGNVCRNAELKYTANGAAICKMSVAVNRFYKAGNDFYKEVSFFDVDAFSECAKLCAEKVRKGDEIRVSGRLKQNRWQAQDGTNRSQVVIIADYVEFKSKSAAREAPGEPGVEF